MKKVIIDVREPMEYAMGHAKGAINIPVSKLMADMQKLDGVEKDTEIVVYCMSGNRAGTCVAMLNSLGYTNVVNGINKGHVETHHEA